METKHFQVGDAVDRKYTLLREIARGGGGIVYEAEHKFTTRRVAVKVLGEELLGRSEAEYRLLRECRALSVAAHPNIVEVLDAGRDPVGGPYLVMDLLEGRAVDGILASRSKLDPVEAAWLGLQVARGAAKLHRHGLVHRDIKPSNIFVCYNRQGEEQVTLLDFGATTHGGLEPQQRITKDNGIIGTPEYMSPEQLTGDCEPDPRMDIYSIGVMLYECMLGGVPYEGSYGQILLDVHTGKERLLVEKEAKLAHEFRSVVLRAMALRPEDRFDSAAALAAELERLLPEHVTDSMSLLGIRSAIGKADELTSRRQHTRAPYVTPLVMVMDDGTFRFGKTQDVSTGGVLGISQGECDHAQIVAVRMTLPSSGRACEIPVVGRWAKPGRLKTVVGIEFKDLDGACADDIRAYIAEMLSRQEPEIRAQSATIRQYDDEAPDVLPVSSRALA